jgi:radical SAM superfamily enzyme YgiQ (UPF0313 family)
MLRISLTLLAVSRLLIKKYKVLIVYDRLYENPTEKILKECKDALCLGITTMTGHQIQEGLKVARLVRERYPRLPIIWGGWHPSLEPETTIASPYVDIIVKGQGEETLLELVDALAKNKPLDTIKGISYKKDGKIIHNQDRSINTNNFGSMPYHLIDMNKAVFGNEWGSRGINYVSSYGCPHRCGFCAIRIVCKGRWYGLDAQSIVDDFEKLSKEYKINAITLDDPNFFFDKNRIKEFCEEMIKRKLNINWCDANGTVTQLLSYEDSLWDLIARSGCRSIVVGAESGWQKALDLMQKDLKVEQTLELAKKCKEHNIKLLFSFVIGMPWDGDYNKTQKLIDREIKYTLDLADKLISINRKNRVQFNTYTPFPGNPLYQRSLEIGLEAPKSFEEWGGWFYNKKITPWMSKKQVNTVSLLNDYISFFLDTNSYNRLANLTVNKKMMNFAVKNMFKLYQKLAEFRWKHRFFSIPIDYWLYDLTREMFKIA